MLDGKDDAYSCTPLGGRKRFLQTTADFEAGFKSAGAKPKKTIAASERQVNQGVLKTRNLANENAALHAACATEKTARAKRAL